MSVAAPLVVTMVTDRRRLPAARAVAALAADAARAGVDFVQLREKDLGGRALLELAREVAAALAGSATRLVVNARADVASLSGAYGVQLPAEGVPVADVRRAFPGLAVGASCHDAEEVRRAIEEGADWAVLGPVFATPGKEDRAIGVESLRAVTARASIPVHAIGGITVDTLAAVRAAGARGVLAIRPFLAGQAGVFVRAAREA